MEIKELQASMQAAFENLKKAGETQEAEIKKFGTATEETKSIISKINADMDKIKGQIDAVETKMNRTNFGGGESKDPQAEQKKAAFFKFVREGVASLSREEKALVQDTTGEIIVSEDLDNAIYRALPGLTVMRGLASVRQTQSNRVRRRSLNDVTVGWGKLETTSAVLGDFESTLVPDDAYIYVEDALGLTKIGEDELEDSDLNLSDYLQQSFSEAYAVLEDTAFMKGTGHANNQPEGILNGSTVTRFETAASGAFTADDLIKLYYQVPAQYRRNGSFIVNTFIEQVVRLAKDSDGQYLWQPSLQAGAPSLFNGRPIYTQDDLDGTVAATKEIAVFGDVKSAYQVIDRKGSSVTRINELYIADGLIGFKFKRRVGGGVVRPNALRVLKVKA
jgi:HK97 family phage major capsid protein